MFSLLIGLLTLSLTTEANIQGIVCTNTSYYGEVEWVDQEDICCQTMPTAPDCTTADQTVCADVSETVCTMTAIKECTPTPCAITLKMVDVVPQTYTTKECKMLPTTVTHTKVKQVPKNVTKKFCNTLWKINERGQKVKLKH